MAVVRRFLRGGKIYEFDGSNLEYDQFVKATDLNQEAARNLELALDIGIQSDIDLFKKQSEQASQAVEIAFKNLQNSETGNLNEVKVGPINQTLSSDGADALNNKNNKTQEPPVTFKDQQTDAVGNAPIVGVTRRNIPAVDDAGTQVEPIVQEDQQQFISRGVQSIAQPASFTSTIPTRANPLSDFNQYTYNISVYALTPDDQIRLTNAQTPSVEGLRCIVQSGGISSAVEGGAVRDPNFDLDFFIDDVRIDHLLGNTIGAPGTSTEIKFTITEPYGFSFIQRLKRSAVDIHGHTDFGKAHYLMVIRYLGMNQDGERISEGKDFEKFLPFRFTNIVTKAATGAPQYECFALATHNFGQGQKMATIQHPIELNGQTLEDLFNGQIGRGAYSDSQLETGGLAIENERVDRLERGGLATRPIRTGLVAQLNKFQRELVRDGKQEYADKYRVEFDTQSGMGDQTVITPGLTNKMRTSMNKADVNNLLGRGQVNKKSKTFTVNAGQQLAQFLDLMIRNSEYITKQQTHIIDPETDEVRAQPGNEVLAWYTISPRIKPVAYDRKRNDFAYEITYIVQPKKVYDTRIEFFNKAKFVGTHKDYRYWFTGENIEVLDYQIDFNFLYFNTFGDQLPNKVLEANTDYKASKAYQTQGDESNIGTTGDAGQPAARAAGILQSQTDYAQVTLDILGDPDWIPQGAVFYKPGRNFNAFYPQDNSVNYESFEPLFSVYFNTIEDYSEETGDPELINPELKQASEVSATGTNALIYRATQCESNFSRGQFSQRLRGLLMDFTEQDIKTVLKTDPGTGLSDTTFTVPKPLARPEFQGRERAPSGNPVPSYTPGGRNAPPLGGIQYADPVTGEFIDTDIPGVTIRPGRATTGDRRNRTFERDD